MNIAHSIRKLLRIGLLPSAIFLSPSAYPEDVSPELLKSAQEMINLRHYSMAYELLLPKETDYAGDPQYDYLLGVASLESGNINQAIFAFERVIASDPSFGGAHMELGRALFHLNEFQRAKNEFEAVLALNPPLPIKNLTIDYLDKINKQINFNPIKTITTVELSTGYDSNINNGTYHENVQTPIVTFLLNETTQSKKAITTTEKITIDVNYAPNKQNLWIVGASGNTTQYSQYRTYDSQTSTVYAQIMRSSVYRRFGFSLTRHQSYLNLKLNNYGLHTNGFFQYNFTPALSFTTLAGTSAVRFPEGLNIRDFNRIMFGSSLSLQTVLLKPTSINASMTVNRDEPLVSSSEFGNTTLNAQLNSSYYLNRKLTLNAFLQASIADYSKTWWGVDRRDTQINAKFSFANSITKNWIVEPVTGLLVSRSRFDLYDFDKVYATLAIKRLFN